MPASTTILRKDWPKIREIIVKSERYYQVDARRQGTTGKRQAFGKLEEAEAHVVQVLTDAERDRQDKARFEEAGLDLAKRTRAMAVEAEEQLRPLGVTLLDAVRAYVECTGRLKKHGKTIADATAHYSAHLEALARKKDSATVASLAEQWYAFKKSGKVKELRQDTLDDINETRNTLKKAFGSKRILEVTEEDVQDYLDSMTAGPRRRFNVRNRFGQFFNWAIKTKHATTNPTTGIEINVPTKDPDILEVNDCKRLMELCEASHQDLTLYVAICLFAGLRPTECKLLKWESTHIDEGQITVLRDTSKINETRNVPIEANLALWLLAFKGERKGLITRNANLRPRLEKLKVGMGYKLAGENQEGKTWVEDVLRHTYASYWLGKYKDRPHLAENMGNSLKMIKQHYKRIVATSATEAFWKIEPKK